MTTTELWKYSFGTCMGKILPSLIPTKPNQLMMLLPITYVASFYGLTYLIVLLPLVAVVCALLQIPYKVGLKLYETV